MAVAIQYVAKVNPGSDPAGLIALAKESAVLWAQARWKDELLVRRRRGDRKHFVFPGQNNRF